MKLHHNKSVKDFILPASKIWGRKGFDWDLRSLILHFEDGCWPRK